MVTDYAYWDHKIRWQDRPTKLDISNKLGYTYITEAYHQEYIKSNKSCLKASKRLGCARRSVLYVMHRIGAKTRGRGNPHIKHEPRPKEIKIRGGKIFKSIESIIFPNKKQIYQYKKNNSKYQEPNSHTQFVCVCLYIAGAYLRCNDWDDVYNGWALTAAALQGIRK